MKVLASAVIDSNSRTVGDLTRSQVVSTQLIGTSHKGQNNCTKFYIVYTVQCNIDITIKITECTLAIILISQTLFYIPRAMRAHHQEASCRIQALWYNVMSKYIYGIMV